MRTTRFLLFISFIVSTLGTIHAQNLFGPAVTYSAANTPVGLCYGDFNEDGKPDLAVANRNSNNMSVLLGVGSGSFSAAVNYPILLSAMSICTADFNGDGHADLAVTNYTTGLVANYVSVFLGSGTGTFVAVSTPTVGYNAFELCTADFNGDGKADLAQTAAAQTRVDILKGNGAGSFTTVATPGVGSVAWSLCSGDFNNDGKIDLAVSNYNSATVSVLLGTGTGNFTTSVTLSVGANPFGICSVDLNADGKLDLAVTCSGVGKLNIFTGNGLGGFSLASSPVAGTSPSTICSADFNGDGKPDLAVGNRTVGNNVLIFLGTGTATLSISSSYTVPVQSSPAKICAADFNGDGRPDLAVTCINEVAVLLSPGVGATATQTNVSCFGGNNAVATVSVTGGTSPYTYTWSPTGGNAATASGLAAGNYTCAITDATNIVFTQTVTITQPATALTVSINPASAVLCAGNNLTLIANANGGTGTLTYTWSTAANSTSISVAPVANTTYTLNVKDANGCMNTVTKMVTVNALPSVSINGASSLCTGSSTTLNATGATTYTWNTSSNSSGISVSPTGNATYTLTGTDVNGCMNTATKMVTVNALPAVSITGSSSVCAGSNITLNATGATTYTWSTSSNNSTITVAPVSATIYSVTGTDANGCKNTATKNITVSALPSLSISATSTLICTGQSTTLNASGANTYTWSTGTTGASDMVSPTANTGYTVSGTDVNNCSNKAMITVSVSLCTGISSLTNANVSVQLYPNPAGNELFIRSNEAMSGYVVMDVTGKSVAESSGLNTLTASLDLRAYSSGMYVAIIYTGKSVSKLKFVKE